MTKKQKQNSEENDRRGQNISQSKLSWNNINNNNLFFSAMALRDKQILKCQSSASSDDK